ncbi:MAG: T9SS type A sorting domain-containing protein [Bacteroidetes bacterium]|nr:T9SS type A sorting domain-containing protein [Bacteroidota bacterium]
MKILYTLGCLLLASALQAQDRTLFNLNVGNETYYSSTNFYIVSSPGWDDAPITNQQLGFDFNFHGKTYSEFHINPNGNIYFGADPAKSVIDVFGVDLYDNPNDQDTAIITVATAIFGSNKIKIIEWKNARFKNGAANDVANFQIWLDKDANKVTFVFGSCTASAGAFGSDNGPTCAIWDEPSNSYLFLSADPANPTTNRTWKMPFPHLNGLPAEGTTYEFTQMINSVHHPEPVQTSTYPNPATDKLQVRVANGIIQSLRIRNMNGQVQHVAYTIQENKAQVQVDELAPGIYLLCVEEKDNNQVIRFIVQ